MNVKKGKQLKKHLEYLSQIFKFSFLAIPVISIVFALNHLRLADYFPIKTVKVYGLNRLNQQEVRDSLFPLVNRGFFTINVDRIRDRLRQMPWVSDLYVRRVWPDQIVITLAEKKPVARWNDDVLLSEGGELFSPKQETWPEDLPRFFGPVGQQIFMLRNFDDMNRLLLPLHAKISYLELTSFLTWKLTLNNGITMQIGHKDILTRLNQFVKVYPKIIGSRATDVDYIDLRYSNGAAIRWKEMANT
jgi:cell division protein FtsQ